MSTESNNSGTFGLFLGDFAKLRKATISFIMSLCLSTWNNSATSRRILMKLDIRTFFEKLSRKFQFH